MSVIVPITICKHIHLVCRYSTVNHENHENHGEQWNEDGTDNSGTQCAEQSKKHFQETTEDIDFLR